MNPVPNPLAAEYHGDFPWEKKGQNMGHVHVVKAPSFSALGFICCWACDDWEGPAAPAPVLACQLRPILGSFFFPSRTQQSCLNLDNERKLKLGIMSQPFFVNDLRQRWLGYVMWDKSLKGLKKAQRKL